MFLRCKFRDVISFMDVVLYLVIYLEILRIITSELHWFSMLNYFLNRDWIKEKKQLNLGLFKLVPRPRVRNGRGRRRGYAEGCKDCEGVVEINGCWRLRTPSGATVSRTLVSVHSGCAGRCTELLRTLWEGFYWLWWC